MRPLGLLMLAALLVPTAATAAAPPTAAAKNAWKACEQREHADRRIEGCTQVLANKRESAANRSVAFNNRGNAHKAKGQLERAIADYGEAIRLDPRSVWPYSNRGRAYLFTGDAAKARADFAQARRLDAGSVYVTLWLDIAERRAGLPSRLEQTAGKLARGPWPGPIVRVYLGESTPAQALTAAAADPKRRVERVCEVHFYGGQLALAQGNRERALEQLRLAAKSCPRGLIEAISAQAELRALGDAVALGATEQR